MSLSCNILHRHKIQIKTVLLTIRPRQWCYWWGIDEPRYSLFHCGRTTRSAPRYKCKAYIFSKDHSKSTKQTLYTPNLYGPATYFFSFSVIVASFHRRDYFLAHSRVRSASQYTWSNQLLYAEKIRSRSLNIFLRYIYKSMCNAGCYDSACVILENL